MVDGDFEAIGREGADEDHFLGGLADVDKAAGTGELGTKAGHIEVTLLVGLRQPQVGDVDAAPIVEVELIGLIDDGILIHRSTEIQTPLRNAPDHTGLGRQRHVIIQPFFGGDGCYALRHANAQIDNAVGSQFEAGSAGNDFAFVECHGQDLIKCDPRLTGKGRVVMLHEGLLVIGRVFGKHDVIDQNAWNAHVLGFEGAMFDQLFDLHDDLATRVVSRHGNGQRLQGQSFVLHADIAQPVGRGAAKKSDIDWKSFVL